MAEQKLSAEYLEILRKVEQCTDEAGFFYADAYDDTADELIWVGLLSDEGLTGRCKLTDAGRAALATDAPALNGDGPEVMQELAKTTDVRPVEQTRQPTEPTRAELITALQAVVDGWIVGDDTVGPMQAAQRLLSRCQETK